jgi:hypothetical protein
MEAESTLNQQDRLEAKQVRRIIMIACWEHNGTSAKQVF